MINTPMLFCRLCEAENLNAEDICPYCGTPLMLKQYTVKIMLAVDVEAFTNVEAVHMAVDTANGNVLQYLYDVETEEAGGGEEWRISGR